MCSASKPHKTLRDTWETTSHPKSSQAGEVWREQPPRKQNGKHRGELQRNRELIQSNNNTNASFPLSTQNKKRYTES